MHKLPAKVSRIPSKIRYANFCPSSSNAIVSGIDKHVASLAILLERGDMEMFLSRLAELMTRLLRSEALTGRALFVPELDELTRQASLVVAPDRNPPAGSKLMLHVATSVWPIGGHSRVIEDIAASLPEYQHVLIITGMHRLHPVLASVRSRFDKVNLKVHLLQCLSLTEKTRELASLIRALGPDAVLLFAHPEDSVAYAGVAAHAARRVLFFHHADHQPSLGASRDDYIHVDLTPACHAVCNSHAHRHAPILNLTGEDAGTLPYIERSPAVGVTCGSPHKYSGSSEFSYAQLLGTLFSSGVDRVFHVGDMPVWQKDQIRTEIATSGQDAGRVVFLPNAPSLTAKLLELSPDFYLTSHPIGGGKAAVEAMSVGLPILYVRPASTLALLCPDMTFGDSVHVSALGQIPGAIQRLQTEGKALAKRSREAYDNHYSPSAFREGLLSAISGS